MKKTKLLFLSIFLSMIAFNGTAQNGLAYDGVNDRVNCGNNPSVQIEGGAITLEAWIYPTSWRDEVWRGSIINKEVFVPQQGYMIRCGDGGRVNFNFGSGPLWNELNTVGPVLVLNEWQHVAATYDGATQRIYVNGVEVATTSNTALIQDPPANLYLGNNSDASRQFPGRLDEVKIWNIARSPAEVLIDMENTYCTSELPIVGLQAYYPFDQGEAGGINFGENILFDYSGNDNNGTLESFALTGVISNWVEGVSSLTFNGAELESIEVSVCDSYTVPSGDETYTEPGVYMDTLFNPEGCDEILTITVNFDGLEVEHSFSAIACDSYTVPSGDETYIESGTYSDTLTAASGCDSVIFVLLTVNAAMVSAVDVEVCADSYTVPSGDETYLISGVYMDTIATVGGCDSIMTINLSLLESTTADLTILSCDDYTTPSGEATYSESGIYTDIIENGAGCDSTITIDLTIGEVDASAVNSDPELSAVVAGMAYQWIDCDDDFTPIDGATDQTFSPSENGNYAVIVTNIECSDTSDCLTIVTVGIEELTKEFGEVYPNPNNGQFTILVNSPAVYLAKITSMDGRLIRAITISGVGPIELELNESAGVYFVELISNKGIQKMKLVKE